MYSAPNQGCILEFCRRKVAPTADLKKDPSEPSLTIEFARMCLINALATVNRHLSRYVFPFRERSASMPTRKKLKMETVQYSFLTWQRTTSGWSGQDHGGRLSHLA